MHLFVRGFLSDNPSIVVHLPVWFFFPSLIRLQWVLCHFQRLPCVQGIKNQPRDAAQPMFFTAVICSPAKPELKQAAAPVAGAEHLQLIPGTPHGASRSPAVRRALRLPKGGSA